MAMAAAQGWRAAHLRWGLRLLASGGSVGPGSGGRSATWRGCGWNCGCWPSCLPIVVTCAGLSGAWKAPRWCDCGSCMGGRLGDLPQAHACTHCVLDALQSRVRDRARRVTATEAQGIMLSHAMRALCQKWWHQSGVCSSCKGRCWACLASAGAGCALETGASRAAWAWRPGWPAAVGAGWARAAQAALPPRCGAAQRQQPPGQPSAAAARVSAHRMLRQRSSGNAVLMPCTQQPRLLQHGQMRWSGAPAGTSQPWRSTRCWLPMPAAAEPVSTAKTPQLRTGSHIGWAGSTRRGAAPARPSTAGQAQQADAAAEQQQAIHGTQHLLQQQGMNP